MKKAKKVFSYIFSGLGIIYGLVLLFPQLFFANSIEYKNFVVFYHNEDTNIQQLKSVLDKSVELITDSDVFSGEKDQKIFLCNSFGEFALFAPRSRKSFAVTYPLTQNIFLSQSDVGTNQINRNGSENNLRTLSGVIAHEATHVGLENRLGFFKYKLLPTWKNEGYCDYVAQESSYDEKLGWTQICENRFEEDSPSLTYFRYRTYVQYLLEEQQESLDSFLIKDFDIEGISSNSKKVFCLNFSE